MERDLKCKEKAIKFILIILVVVGHFFDSMITNGSNIEAIYMLIYSIHMPLFVFISGYFYKHGTSKSYEKIIRQTLIPYTIFQTLYSLYNIYILHTENFKINYFIPYNMMWYLLSLFFWYTLTPYILKFKHPIVLSFIAAILIGYIPNVDYFMSTSRSFTYYPFFLIGYFTGKNQLERIVNGKKRKITAVLILSALLIIFKYISPNFDHGWFWGLFSYSNFGENTWYAGIYRIFVYVVSLMASVSVLMLIPVSKTIFSNMGTRTMYPFLLHGFVVKGFIALGIFQFANTLQSKLGLTFCAIIVATLLSTGFVKNIFKFLVEPKIDWIFSKSD